MVRAQGVLGNKGAVTICLDFMGSRLAFTTAHFAAHQHRVKSRNATFQEVCAETTIPSLRSPELGDFTVASDLCFWCGDLNYRLELPRTHVIDVVRAANEKRPPTPPVPAKSPRVGGRLHVSEEEEGMGSNARGAGGGISPFSQLWRADQLRIEMAAQRVFTGWSEVANPDFPPSYKYSRQPPPPPGTSPAPRTYGDEEGKRRVPSYTDRVLYRANCSAM